MSEFYRTLISIDVIKGNDYAFFYIPAWNARQYIRVHKDRFPQSVFDYIAQGGMYCHAWVNLNAKTGDDLTFSEWEFGDNPDLASFPD